MHPEALKELVEGKFVDALRPEQDNEGWPRTSNHHCGAMIINVDGSPQRQLRQPFLVRSPTSSVDEQMAEDGKKRGRAPTVRLWVCWTDDSIETQAINVADYPCCLVD